MRQSPQTKMKVPLHIVNGINFQSTKIKQCPLSIFLQNKNPEIVFVTETWLDENIKTKKIFLEDIKCIEKTKRHPAVKMNLTAKKPITEDAPEIDSDY